LKFYVLPGRNTITISAKKDRVNGAKMGML
jgi:hypothetical protein